MIVTVSVGPLPLLSRNRLMYLGTWSILSMGMAMNVTEIDPPTTISRPSSEKNIMKLPWLTSVKT